MSVIDPLSSLGARALQGSPVQPGGSTGVLGSNEPAGVDFAAVLGQLASQAAETLRASEAVSVAGVQGNASVQQVVEAVMAAEQTLQGAIAIRDKVLAAYLELSRMSI
jgi:flagellar hook-basal body complex protein FliE